MLKKISVFALLLSLFVTLAPQISLRADDSSYPSNLPALPSDIEGEIIVFQYGSAISMRSYNTDDLSAIREDLYFGYKDSSSNYLTFCYDGDVSGVEVYRWWYNLEGSTWVAQYQGSGPHTFNNGEIDISSNIYDYTVLYSTLPVVNVVTNEVIYTPAKPAYTFLQWCTDAGLSCSASSNESDSVIPFWYEPDSYNYIVRKTLTASSTSGVYQMTMLQKTDGAHYPYYFEVNDIGYLGVAGAFSDTSTFTVRNFYYDAEGNGWKYIERFDVSTLPFDNTNVNFTDDVVFIYSDTDIYADREASSIWKSASTEYYNVDIPEPEAPTPTPTTVPSSGAGRPGSGTRPDIGGEATGGGGLDFIINLFTLIWQKICSIPMAVDGYSISLQQIFVYGALVSIVGGFIIKFIFRR